jgi:hypothetical protein
VKTSDPAPEATLFVKTNRYLYTSSHYTTEPQTEGMMRRRRRKRMIIQPVKPLATATNKIDDDDDYVKLSLCFN